MLPVFSTIFSRESTSHTCCLKKGEMLPIFGSKKLFAENRCVLFAIKTGGNAARFWIQKFCTESICHTCRETQGEMLRIDVSYLRIKTGRNAAHFWIPKFLCRESIVIFADENGKMLPVFGSNLSHLLVKNRGKCCLFLDPKIC